jgi:UDP-GlcNAc:undecaprenyl-phosphate GlcNAc-1-phosphate transferase
MLTPLSILLAQATPPTVGGDAPFVDGDTGLSTAVEAALPVPSIGTALDIFHGYIGVFIVAFLVTLIATPIMRKLAIANGIVDRPSESRKVHRLPIAYLGGVAVFLGMLAAIAFSYIAPDLVVSGRTVNIFEPHGSRFEQSPVPVSVVVGMFAIMFTGLLDDVARLIPRSKIGGQLLAAAALSYQDIGTKVAAGLLHPIGAFFGNQDLRFSIPLPFELPGYGSSLTVDLIYWTGVIIIAVFVLGACNASNLVDGLDGLLSGITAIASMGLLLMALWLAASDDGWLDSSRVVLALALLGACLGFLPHNFNPATIFLGDAGSLLLGYVTIVIVLMMGDTGKTHLVVAGLIIYSIPIIDTVLAMVRRKLAGRSFAAADDQHLHHMLKRALGVKGAVLTLYAAGLVFAGLGIWLSMGRVRVVCTIAMVVWAFIGVAAVKVARRQVLEAQCEALAAGPSPVRPSVRKEAEPRKPTPAR